jgi:hypothetical protein
MEPKGSLPCSQEPAQNYNHQFYFLLKNRTPFLALSLEDQHGFDFCVCIFQDSKYHVNWVLIYSLLILSLHFGQISYSTRQNRPWTIRFSNPVLTLFMYNIKHSKVWCYEVLSQASHSFFLHALNKLSM